MTEAKEDAGQQDAYDYKRLHSYPLIRVSISKTCQIVSSGHISALSLLTLASFVPNVLLKD